MTKSSIYLQQHKNKLKPKGRADSKITVWCLKIVKRCSFKIWIKIMLNSPVKYKIKQKIQRNYQFVDQNGLKFLKTKKRGRMSCLRDRGKKEKNDLKNCFQQSMKKTKLLIAMMMFKDCWIRMLQSKTSIIH